MNDTDNISDGVICAADIEARGILAVVLHSADDAFDDFTQGLALGQKFPYAARTTSNIHNDPDADLTQRGLCSVLHAPKMKDAELEAVLVDALAARTTDFESRTVAAEAAKNFVANLQPADEDKFVCQGCTEQFDIEDSRKAKDGELYCDDCYNDRFCKTCGGELDGDGWDGNCGNCADKAERGRG